MDFLEFIWYESLPYLYACLAVFAFTQHDTSKLIGLAGIVLGYCSYHVFAKRYEYRTYSVKYDKSTPRI